jgi:hypothetical protein
MLIGNSTNNKIHAIEIVVDLDELRPPLATKKVFSIPSAIPDFIVRQKP